MLLHVHVWMDAPCAALRVGPLITRAAVHNYYSSADNVTHHRNAKSISRRKGEEMGASGELSNCSQACLFKKQHPTFNTKGYYYKIAVSW